MWRIITWQPLCARTTDIEKCTESRLCNPMYPSRFISKFFIETTVHISVPAELSITCQVRCACKLVQQFKQPLQLRFRPLRWSTSQKHIFVHIPSSQCNLHLLDSRTSSPQATWLGHRLFDLAHPHSVVLIWAQASCRSR